MSSARKFFPVALFIVSAAIASTSACRKASQPSARTKARPSNVLIITLDTTRADHLGCYGRVEAQTPNLDRLAAEGVRFANAHSPVPLTLPAHASIFTGVYPLFHNVRNNGSYSLPPNAETLAEILQKRGYATAAFVSSFVLDSRFGLGQGFDVYNDDMNDGGRIKTLASEIPAAGVFDRFAAWFAARPSKPFLAWVHFFDPHLPYAPPEPFKSDRSLSPYDGEIAYVDLHIGRILDLLASRGTLDRTLIIAAGDHGEGFGEHGETGHGVFCYNETVSVPLIVRGPGKFPSNRVSRVPVSLVDIVPTVLDFLKLPLPSHVQGLPLQRQLKKAPRGGRPLFVESVFLNEGVGSAIVTGVIHQGFKFIRLPRPELYNLDADPKEKVNIVSSPGTTTRRFLKELESFEKSAAVKEASAKRRMSAEERARLESLGYISAQPPQPASEAVFSDPKDIIRAWTLYQEGEHLLGEGETAAAEAKFMAAARENRRIINAYSNLAEIYYRRNDIPSLERILAEGISANTQNGTLRLRRLYYHFRLGRTDSVLKELDEAEPLMLLWQKEQFYNLAGTACGRAGRYDRAAGYFKKVLDIEPANSAAAKDLGYALFMEGRTAEALTYQKSAEEGLPLDPQLAAETAATLSRLGDYPAAERYYEKSLRLDPADEVVFQYAEMLAGQKEYGRAIAVLKAFSERPASSPAFRGKARRLIILWQKH
ncbi:MAG TPA: sulfatase-like hydrolase/transferase [Candidatus Aminicenantes bacterium]|nr:sulfatase-like hydrolase/transferase [Candidatus Aminicenantes bacterium]